MDSASRRNADDGLFDLWCSHPQWHWPSPEPPEGMLCPNCGQPYEPPTGTINAVPWSELGPEAREDVRAICEIRGLLLLLQERAINTRTANNEMERIARLRGWITREEDDPAELD
jgi:hypothetical protein